MRIRGLCGSLVLAAAALLVGSGAHAAAVPVRVERTGAGIALRNARCRLEISARTGEILSLRPGPPSLRGPWFEVVEEDRTGLRPWETWRTGKESTFSSGPADVQASASGRVARVRMRWVRPNGLTIVGEAVLLPDDPGPRLRLTVVNGAARALVDTIRMPVLRGIDLPRPTEAWFTWPHTLGARFRVAGFKPGEVLEQPYPAFLYMQWLDLHDSTQGVYVGAEDSYGYSKSLMIGREPDGRSLMAIRFPGCWVAARGDRWTTPWVRVAAHRGDWRAGAGIYRAFAQRAFGPPWAPELIRQMPTAQCWLAHHARDADVGRLFEVQQQAPIHASYLMKSVDTSTPEGWDGLRGSALDLRRAFERIRQLGGSPALFTFDRAPLMGKPNYADYLGRWACRRRDGSFEEGFRDLMPSPFDPTFVEARVREAVRWVREFGLGEIHYDTEATAGVPGPSGLSFLAGPSYGPGAGHRPNETPHYFKELYRRIVAACRRYNPGFTLRAEHLADFWFPEFSTGTAHFLSTATGTLVQAHHPPADAQLMPLLFRYTLPRHAAFMMPSMGMSDFWPYGYGMGHGFHGGGPSWTFNTGVREAESPPGELAARYAFYEADWRGFYDFRVGFEEAVVDADWSDTVAHAFIDGRWSRCDYPGPLVAVTSAGGRREVTLGQWYPQEDTSPFGKAYVGGAVARRGAALLRVPTRITRPSVRLFDRRGEVTCRARLLPVGPQLWSGLPGARHIVEVRVEDASCFALEVCEGPALTLKVPTLASPGTVIRVSVDIVQQRPAATNVALELPAGWPKTPARRTPELRRCRVVFPVAVPKGVFGRNYPVQAVVTGAGVRRVAAGHLTVMEPLTVLYDFDDPTNPGRHCLDPGRPAELRVTCINNAPDSAAVEVAVTGEQVRGRAVGTLDPMPTRDLLRPDSPLQRWIGGSGPSPGTVMERRFRFACSGALGRPVRIEVRRNGRPAFRAEAYPRTRLMDLNGPWQARFTPVSRATVGGAERYEALDTEAVTPDVWDGGWRTVNAPVAFEPRVHQDNAWGLYRRLVYIPAEWQGAELWLRLSRTGAPWGEGGTLNLVYVNGWPAGRVPFVGECPVSAFIVYGGWNLIAVASTMPNSLIDPYLFVRGAPAPERLRPAVAGPRPPGAFALLSGRITGQGLTLPFIQGVAEEGYRRTDLPQGGENAFIYFAVADEFLREPSQAVEVEVEYLDRGLKPFGLDYDSRDRSAPVDGAFKSAGMVARTNTGLWKRHVFRLTDALFANREHMGSDFRILAEGDDLAVRRVDVRAAR